MSLPDRFFFSIFIFVMKNKNNTKKKHYLQNTVADDLQIYLFADLFKYNSENRMTINSLMNECLQSAIFLNGGILMFLS